MRKLFCVLIFSLLHAGLAAGQIASVTRNVNLRPTASTSHSPLAHLSVGARLSLLDANPTDGFYHAKTEDGMEGWVWGHNIRIEQNTTGTGNQHVGPASLYPDPQKTPGKEDTLSVEDLTKIYTDNCPNSKPSCTYSQDHRNVPKAEHDEVYNEYAVPQAKRNIKDGEVDHFYPLCAGGSNDISNLWYQPADNQWNGNNFGYHEKDRLETDVCARIKARTLDPKDAYDRITKDWVKFYLDEGLDGEN